MVENEKKFKDTVKDIPVSHSIEELYGDFGDLNLSFIDESKKLNYFKFNSNEILSDYLFTLIGNKKLEVAVLPIVGSNNIKWFTKTIKKGNTLVALVPIDYVGNNDVKISFLGVVE